MSTKPLRLRRRTVIQLGAASLASAALPSFIGTGKAEATAELLPPVIDGNLSPSFADIFTRLPALRARYRSTVELYMAIPDELVDLHESPDQAEASRFWAHSDVRAHYEAATRYFSLWLKALSIWPNTVADCDVQEWCVRLGLADELTSPERVQQLSDGFRNARSYARYKASKAASAAEGLS